MIFPSPLLTEAYSQYAPAQWLRPLLPPEVWGEAANKVNTTRAAGVGVQHAPAVGGFSVPGCNSTFYNRIIVEPSSVDMGNMTSDQTRTVVVWNGFLTNKSLSSFLGTESDGIQVTQPLYAPCAVKPLVELTYAFNISTDGPADIKASFCWTFSGVPYYAKFTGRRVTSIGIRPNWKEPLVETLEWKTDVIRAYSGKEQRRMGRQNARRSWTYKFMATWVDAQTLDNQLWVWQNRMYAIPVWTDRSDLTSAAGVGDTIINLQTDTYSFSDVDSVVIMDDYGKTESCEIDSVGVGAITLKAGTLFAWDKGSSVYPLAIAHLPEQVPMQRHSGAVVAGEFDFSAKTGVTGDFIPVGAAPVTFDGHEVVTRQPNWVQPITWNSDFQFSKVESQTGMLEYLTKDKYARVVRDYSWLLTTRAEILEFRKFLGRMAGQLAVAWFPTWTQDFLVTKDHRTTDNALTVTPNGFKTLVGVDTNRCALMIRTTTGVVLYRKVVSVASDQGKDVIQLDSALGVDIPKSQVAGIHLMQLCRFASDKINLEWHSLSVVAVKVSITSVPQ